jgi:hypothetical protein
MGLSWGTVGALEIVAAALPNRTLMGGKSVKVEEFFRRVLIRLNRYQHSITKKIRLDRFEAHRPSAKGTYQGSLPARLIH